MAVDVDGFKAEYTEFGGLVDSVVTAAISRAELQVSSAWGTFQDEGTKLLTAHFLSRSTEAKASSGKGQGPITSIDITDQGKRSFAQPQKSSSSSEYSSTIYGQQFETLRNSVIAPILII